MDPAVFGYIRVSQAEGASGLDTQCRILTGHGLRGDRIYSDVASGRNMRRPGWQQLRGKLQPGDVIRDRIRAGVDHAAAEGWTGGRPPALDSEKLRAVRDFLDTGGSVSAAARAFRVSRPTVRAVKDGTYPDQNGSAL